MDPKIIEKLEEKIEDSVIKWRKDFLRQIGYKL